MATQSPERHHRVGDEEESGGDTKWNLRSFLDSPFRKGDQPDWQDVNTDADIYPGTTGGFGMPKTLPGAAGIRSRDTAVPTSMSKPRMPHKAPEKVPQRPREARPAVKAVKAPSKGEHSRSPSVETGTIPRSDVAAVPKKPVRPSGTLGFTMRVGPV